MKERPILFSAPMVQALLEGRKTQTRRVVKPRKDRDFGCLLLPNELAGEVNAGCYVSCPYGQPGDRLWVRETWRTVSDADNIAPRNLMNVEPYTHYEADAQNSSGMGKLRPSIFMPRWASRILLEVTGIRVERLQDISGADALAEGILERRTYPPESDPEQIDIAAYRDLWESINGAGSWDANPWVWVIGFRRIES